MRIKPLGLAERDRRGTKRTELLRPAFEDRGALHEVEYAEPRRETRRARSRQHVIGAADIVADCFRRMRAKEDRARIPDADRKSTRLNSSHLGISYAVFCLKK